MIFVFYQFVTPPIFFNSVETANIKNSAYSRTYQELETKHERIHKEKQAHIRDMLAAIKNHEDSDLAQTLQTLQKSRDAETKIREEAVVLIKKADPGTDTDDTNYIFLSFVINFLPVGVIGLILACILSASMSSTSAELNALASVTVVDIYKRVFKKSGSDRHYLAASRLATVLWGIYAINSALFINRLGSLGALIEAVNILGSFFYGTMLGIFLIGFFFKNIGGNATFIAALIAESAVLACFFFTEIPYLWFNVIGCVVLIILAHLMNPMFMAMKNNKA
jgi:hypothetical protein